VCTQRFLEKKRAVCISREVGAQQPKRPVERLDGNHSARGAYAIGCKHGKESDVRAEVPKMIVWPKESEEKGSFRALEGPVKDWQCQN
jgi:hypothetical protein